RENYPEKEFPTNRQPGTSAAIAGSNMLPDGYERRSQTSPLFSYPYARVRDSLGKLASLQDPDACHAYKMNCNNPLTGGSAMPTLSTAMQLFPAGYEPTGYRSTAGTVFSVVEGAGQVRIGSETYAFGPKDIFVVPSWRPCSIAADDDCMIFSFSDRIVQEKLDIFREQRGIA